jgi:hypothetical protein
MIIIRWNKLLPIALFTLVGCGSLSVNEGLDRVKPGMDKDEVLGLVDNPKHSFHKDGRDHWIFDYYQDDHEMLRDVTFENGRVVEVGPAHLRGAGSAGADVAPTEDDEDMEKFESKVRESQKQHQGSFQDVPEQ